MSRTLKPGSFVADGPCCWRWIKARIPTLSDAERLAETPTFLYQGTEWFLRCCETRDGFEEGMIRLWLYPKSWPPASPSAPFAVSTRALGMGPESKGMTGRGRSWFSPSLIIWQRRTSEVRANFPRFNSDRLLTFRIDIKEQDPQIGCNSAPVTAPHCPRPELHTMTFADASAQTSLSGIAISCLDALSEDFSKMLDADSNLDVELQCEDLSTKAHKSVLSSRCHVLANMLHTDMVEGKTGVVNFRDMDAGTLRPFLRFLYTGKVDEDALTFDSAMSLYEAGDMYGVLTLKSLCSVFLRAKLTIDNACEALAVADLHVDTIFVEAVNAYTLRKVITQSIQEISENDVDNRCNSAGPASKVFTLAHYCPNPKIHAQTFADASIQTSLTSISISCLEALSEDFSRMLDADPDRDVELHCEGHSTRAHRNVLCARSGVLDRMLRSDIAEGRTGEINIMDLDVATFRRFLLYLYTGKLDEDSLTFDSAISLYKAGVIYGVISLRTLCSDSLRSKLTFDNACEFLVVAHALADTSFVEAVTDYILEKEIPQLSDQWPAFCDRNPDIAAKVLNEFVRLKTLDGKKTVVSAARTSS